jgi:quercetin dioxygenase-like cupin family protein
MKIMPGGLVKSQSHPEQHAVLILNGRCKILLGEEWVKVKDGNYLYIPADMTHAFANEEDMPVEILILKK